jgi:hypothetical protein
MNGGNRDRWEEERAELKQVLASRAFSRAPALSRILAYVCEKHFQGESESIKEYNIAIDALGRPPHFDSGSDTIVRVEASRLRKRLREYYDDEGSGHPIQILLPESGYLPKFVTRPESPSTPPETPASAPAPRKSHSMLRFAGGAILLAAGILLLTVSRGIFQPARKSDAAGVAAIGRVPAQPAPSVEAGAAENGIRILAGFNGPKFIDSQGRVWLSDRYYLGGNPVVRRFRRIYRTRSQELYRTARVGDFQYDIPLKPGVYELHLHFVESVSEETDLDSGGEQTSRFHVFLNGKMLLRAFDIVADAFGPNVADERVFTDISPDADGKVHLKFTSFMNRAHVTAIEILPGIPGKMRPVRMVAAPDSVIDAQGNLWSSDLYALGGKITRRGSEVDNTSNPALYSSERWGHFNYAIPAAPGSYRLTLRFAETYPAPFRIGERVFDVYCNGVVLLKDFDVFAEAGKSNRAWDKTFTGLRPNAQGKLMLSFVPVLNYAIVNAIEVTPE